MRIRYILAVTWVTLLLLVSCDLPQPSLVPGTSPLTSPLSVEMPRPTLVVPAPNLGTGVVIGAVVVRDTQQPMSGIGLYLGRNIGSESDSPLYGVDPQTAPYVVADDYGRFVFADVPPGEYVLVLWTPHQSIMVSDIATGGALQFTVAEGQIADLGTVSETRP